MARQAYACISVLLLWPVISCARLITSRPLGSATVSVVEANDVLYMVANGAVLGAQYIDPERRDDAVFPADTVLHAARYLNRPLHRALQVGMGTGGVASYFRQHGIPTDVVEAHEEIVMLAEAFFDYEHCTQSRAACPHGKTVVSDALDYIEQHAPVKPAYDLVVIDAASELRWCSDDTLWLLKQSWLRTDGTFTRLFQRNALGVLVLSLVGFSSGPHAALLSTVYATFRSTFQHVKVYRDGPDTTDAATLVVFGSSAAIAFTTASGSGPTRPLLEVAATSEAAGNDFEAWQVLSTAADKVEVTVEHDALTNDLTFDDLKPVDEAHVLSVKTDWAMYEPAIAAVVASRAAHWKSTLPPAVAAELSV
uniref:Secreted protein n=1 Tax=Achlya hypogyna TaxID=1202772 RepID=A0A0A7CNP5_ACHHY|nr:secreted protein [Achlya hypogyna]